MLDLAGPRGSPPPESGGAALVSSRPRPPSWSEVGGGPSVPVPRRRERRARKGSSGKLVTSLEEFFRTVLGWPASVLGPQSVQSAHKSPAGAAAAAKALDLHAALSPQFFVCYFFLGAKPECRKLPVLGCVSALLAKTLRLAGPFSTAHCPWHFFLRAPCSRRRSSPILSGF